MAELNEIGPGVVCEIATDYIVEGNEIIGCFGIDVEEEILYVIEAKAVICSTGGASGLYKPNNPILKNEKNMDKYN